MHKQITTISLTAFDSDELRDRLGRYGDFQNFQLDAGPFRGQLSRSYFGDSILDMVRYSRDLLVRGSYPPDRVTLGLILSSRKAGYFNGTRFAVNDIVIIGEGATMDAYRLPAGTRLVGLQTSRKRLEREGIDIPKRSQMRFHSRLSPEALQLSRYVEAFLTSQSTANRCNSGDAFVAEDDLMTFFRRAIDASQNLDQRAHHLSYRSRQRTIRKLEEIIESHLASDLRIPEICSQLGISQRTLEYLCDDYCGMPPRRYLTVRRLNAVRGSLLNPVEDGNSIVAIAKRFRFSHPGRFAQQYRDLFGELPSKTRQERVSKALRLR